MPAKGWKSRCYSWFSTDVMLLTAEMPAELKGAWVDSMNRGMLSDDTPGVDLATISTLAHRWGVGDDRTLVILAELATRTEEVQRRENEWSLFGVLTVEIELSAGVWTTLKRDTLRHVIDSHPHPLAMVRIVCQKVATQAHAKALNTKRMYDKRGKPHMEAKTHKIESMCGFRASENRTCSPCVEDNKIPLNNNNPLPPTGGPQEGQLPGIPVLEKEQTEIPPTPPPAPPVMIPETSRSGEAKKRARAGVESKKRLQAKTTPEMDRVGSWFGHAAGAGWTLAEADAWGQVQGLVQPQDLDALEWYYTQARKRHGARRFDRQQADGFWLCRHKVTLLNKWSRQVEMALERKEKDRNGRSDELVA
jgi:hypothetical protein